jgi:hypothetical protein
MTAEPVETCAWCSYTFIPSQRQLGQQSARGCALYCTAECEAAADAERSRAFYRSPEGRAYQRAVRAKRKLKRRKRAKP